MKMNFNLSRHRKNNRKANGCQWKVFGRVKGWDCQGGSPANMLVLQPQERMLEILYPRRLLALASRDRVSLVLSIAAIAFLLRLETSRSSCRRL